ncbi:hypothetical protein I546_1356 [Mycobacterium kansasii 732]|uniref:DUF1275 domain-containing protein n=1 Tax=Mycobacterium pseudokansasii TaxID=2341080 RepID=A0A498QGN0_9MYCO|nr:YoaK family protein [Mycobacterium pseudokansasii]EUA15417.1 hypothetical protein I546_1356 [Mycobacterium kansasii 732]KZS67747.1 hypothetical protein A4G27_15000 [Mycobacterium kansasii]MBY0387875.1 DUF1275 domain-containing protein [Mycobacterium pseudokansasii]VAZ88042.1 hypothetical protein LAUMK35_00419 [Mycobacterium pseudokansasii]VAZ88409.1 hypothetical protein LAUMK21_00419 [Mycobacterium pseudokansasii]
MAVSSPRYHRLTIAALLLLTFATGLADAISVLVLGHVFVANMTGNVIFLGICLVPKSQTGIDLVAGLVSVVTFVIGTIIGGRFTRALGREPRRWISTALGTEVLVLATLSVLAGSGVLHYHDNTKLFLIGGLALTFGLQNAIAREFGIRELSTTMLTSTIVAIGAESRLAGGTGGRNVLRYSVIAAMCGGALLGAIMSRATVAPVFALAAAVIWVSMLVFRYGPVDRKTPQALTS